MIEIGTKAPDFCAKNQDDIEICSRDLKGKWIVLYFYPKDLTPGCTTEACDFTQSEPDFDDLDAIILGVSPDDTQKHRRFIEKKELTITLLSDIDKKMCEDYGVWQLKKFMGKEYMGVVRSTFIINPEGEIAAMWTKVKVKGHVEAVKEKLKELQN
ncbi:thioredoxin-dependent thiol peroxidase [Arcobacter sp. CECT 8986]|uniref:thioredoxin-dependent thiol peroxidase n=1 Tax=Arcobacter sp. CECT 8986 TaxID=2044507 RepID=UPI001009FCDC|nr:thioredoxin-dependent thiol peroxidase [Arcobacter sp. CECT 8986]RXJ97608.1 thioredoxin-dependent thiol peroxidase [Arcobacter sp. CECT 8986]